MHACRECALALAGSVRFAFLRTAGIGGSQRARRTAPAHAMTHASERMHMKKHAGRMVHATMHAHAHAARDLSSFAKRVDGHVFSIENEAEERHKGAIVYLQTIQLFIL
mgnify:CR=1 FL=1